MTIDWRDVGGTGDLLRYVDSRYAANRNGGDLDVAWGGGIDPYFELQKKRYLARYDPPAALLERIRAGKSLEDALCEAFATMGTSVIFTGFALALGVGTWAFSALKFQADMGVLLAFMFLFNMLGATLLMPALARRLFHGHIEEKKLRVALTQPPASPAK